MLSLAIVVVAAVAGAQAAGAQPPAQPPATATPAAAPQAPQGSQASQPPQAESYAYQPEGRRDPFLSLVGTGGDNRSNARRGDGPSGIGINELTVKGVLQSRTGLVAMIQGPDKKTYIVHQGDRLADGTIKTITPQGLVLMQEVNDPLSLVKQREVTKLLRSPEGAKE